MRGRPDSQSTRDCIMIHCRAWLLEKPSQFLGVALVPIIYLIYNSMAATLKKEALLKDEGEH